MGEISTVVGMGVTRIIRVPYMPVCYSVCIAPFPFENSQDCGMGSTVQKEKKEKRKILPQPDQEMEGTHHMLSQLNVEN